MTWLAQPDFGASFNYGQRSGQYGGSTCTPGGAWLTFTQGDTTGTIQGLVQAWADGTYPSYGVAILADDETQGITRYFWSKDNPDPSKDPYLEVNYNNAPSTPTSLKYRIGSGSELTASSSSTAPNLAQSLTPTLIGTYSDPDAGDSGYLEFEVYRVTDGVLVSSDRGDSAQPGETSRWTLSTGTLQDGVDYKWRARAYDQWLYSSWTSYRYFRPDVSGPTGPLTAPANETTVSGSQNLTAAPIDGTEGSGVDKVEFYATSLGRRTLIGTDTSSTGGWTATLDTRTLPEGRALLNAEYTDKVGNASCCAAGSGASVIVDNAQTAPEPWVATEAAEGISVADHDAAVVLKTGQLVLGAEDDSLPGRGFSAAFQRAYNSGSSASTILGPGWRINLDDALVASHDGSILHVDAAGRELRYAPVTTAGLEASFWNNTTLSGTPSLTRTDSNIDFAWGSGSPGSGVNADNFSSRWTGMIDIPAAGTWTFYVGFNAGERVLVDGVPVIEEWSEGTAGTEESGQITLAAGLHEIRVEHYEAGGDASAILRWSGPGVTKAVIPASALKRVTGYTAPPGSYDPLVRNADGTYTMTGHEQTEAHFLADGRRDSIEDPNGNTLRIGYDSAKRPKYVCFTTGSCTSSAAKLTITYDASGRVSELSDTYPRSWAYDYDTNGRLWHVTDPLSNVTTYAYDASGRLASITDAEGGKGTVAYDASGRVSALKDPRSYAVAATCSTSAPCTTFTYGTNAATVVSPKANALSPTGAGTAYALGAAGELSSATDPLGNQTSFTFDSNFNILSESDELNQTTRFTYDSRGNLLSETDPLNHTTTRTYDAENNLLTTTDALGNVTTNTYDAAGNLASETDPLGKKTTYSYDSYGQLIAEVDPRGNEAGADPNAFKTTYAYDAAGNTTSETDPLGTTTTYTFDAAGNQLTQTDPVVTGETQGHTTSSTYDALGRALSTTDAEGNKTSYGYDKVGRQTSAVDPRGYATGADPAAYTSRTTYFADGSVKDEIDALGNSATNAYDWDGNLVAETDPRGNVTSSTFDLAGRLTSTTEPDGGVTTFEYFADGQTKAVTDPKGTTSYVYDGVGRLTETLGPRTASDGSPLKTTYRYDDADNVISTTDPAGNVAGAAPGSYTTTNAYNAAGHLASVTDAVGTTGYSYDAAGNQTHITDPTGAATKFTYDALGRQTERRVLGSKAETVTNSVDANGTATATSSITTTMPGTINAALDWTTMAPQDVRTRGGSLAAGVTTTYDVGAHGESILEGKLTWAKGETTSSPSFPGALTGGGNATHAVSVTSTHTAITGSVDWTTYGKAYSQSGTVPALGSATKPITVEGPGTISASVTWENSTSSTLTPQTRLQLQILDPAGNVVASSPSSASQPLTLSHTVNSLASPATYTVKVISSDLGANYTLSGATPTSADVNLQLLNSSNTIVAQDTSTTARPATITYTPTSTGTYTFKVISVADPAPSYTLSTTYPILAYPNVTFKLLNPSNGVLQTLSSSDGAAGLTLTPYQVTDAGGAYKVSATNNSGWSTPSFNIETKSTLIRPVTKTGSLAAGGTDSHTFTSDGAGALEADIDWTQGQTTQSSPFASSLTGGQTKTHSVSVTSTHAPITGSVDWTTYLKSSSHSGTVAPLGTQTYDVIAEGPGDIRATMTWENSSNPALTPQTSLNLWICNEDETNCGGGGGPNQPLTTSRTVSGPYPSTYRVRVESPALGANYSLTIETPKYADVNLQLLNPSNTVVAQDTSTTARPAAISYTPTATGTYTFKVISVADPAPSYTLSTTYPILAYADVVAKVYDPSDTLVTTTVGRPGKVLFTTATQGTYRVEVVNRSAATTVGSYTLTVRPPTSTYANLDLQLLNSAGDVVAEPSDRAVRPEALSYANAPAGTYTLKVTAANGYGAFTLERNTPTEQVETTTIDEAGRQKTRTDPEGTTTFVYDKADRLKTEQLPDGSSFEYSYLENGSTKRVTDASGVQDFTYDTVGRLATEARDGVTTTHSYDATGNEASVVRGSSTVTKNFDSTNRLSAHTATGTTSFDYADKVNRTSVTAVSGEVDTSSFDAGNLSLDTTMKDSVGASAPRLKLAYRYDPQGNLLEVTDVTGTPATVASYAYDTADRLESEQVKVGSQTQTFSYNYDVQGNRTSVVGPSGTTTARYNPAGQLTATVAPSGALPTYLYESEGNLSAVLDPTGKTTYGWTANGRLARVTLPSDSAVSFTYDANGARITKTIGSTATTYAYEGGRLFSETTGSAVTRYTYDDSGAPLAITLPSGATYTYHYDGRGSVVQLTDSSHSVAASYTYDAWGNVLAQSGTQAVLDANPFIYRGQYGVRWDRETRLFLMGARYYEPSTGRFISRDPAEADPSASSYAYALNNPVANLDPTGLDACWYFDANGRCQWGPWDGGYGRKPEACPKDGINIAKFPAPRKKSVLRSPLRNRFEATTYPGGSYKGHGGHHGGIDIKPANAGEPESLVAVCSGYISTKSFGKAYGNQLTITADNPKRKGGGWKPGAFYAHLKSLYKRDGEYVKAGEKIGKMGNSGNSTNVHLHFEWRNDWRVSGNLSTLTNPYCALVQAARRLKGVPNDWRKTGPRNGELARCP